MTPVRRARFFALSAAALAVFFGFAQPSRAVETVSVSGGVSNGSGVLVLDWPAPVIFSAAIEGDRLVLKFARPFDAAFAPALSFLGDFITAGGLYPDRRTAVFALKRRDMVLRSYYDGPRVIVELFPLAPETISPSARPQTAERPRPAPEPAPRQAHQPAPQKAQQQAQQPAPKPTPPPAAFLSPVERGRVLLAENRPGPALVAVAGESGAEAERLRLDAHWRRGDWKSASASAQKLCQGISPPLAESDQRLVLDAAIAASLARDEKSLASLNSRFGAAMERGSYRHPFRLLAGANDSGDLSDRVGRLSETAEGVRRFLAEARASTARVP